jgi:quercetin dioxygenase-like cupin family protein
MAEDACVVWMPGGTRTEIHLDASDTGGAFCMIVDHPPPDWSLPEHRHTNEAETIHVVDGEFELMVDGRPLHLSSGQTVHVPRGVLHSGRNVGGRPGRRVLIFSPAGMERFFLDAGASLPDEEIDRSALLAAAARHGWEFASAR